MRDLLYVPLIFWRWNYGKPLTFLAIAMACLWTGHVFFFNVFLVVALHAYMLYD
tara:strand:+ start:477 stop:638 length:162 start_codon:yes stop_codon:yes gene_type:complete